MPFHMPFGFFLFLYFSMAVKHKYVFMSCSLCLNFSGLSFTMKMYLLMYFLCLSKSSLDQLWISKARTVNSKIVQSYICCGLYSICCLALRVLFLLSWACCSLKNAYNTRPASITCAKFIAISEFPLYLWFFV
jgi:hypothetical protein